METFTRVVKVIVIYLFLHLPESEEEWANECKGFTKNYEFLCVDVWDGFHVHVATRLRNYCSFKNKYTVTSMVIIDYDKLSLHLTTAAPGTIYDTCLLRYTSSGPIF